MTLAIPSIELHQTSFGGAVQKPGLRDISVAQSGGAFEIHVRTNDLLMADTRLRKEWEPAAQALYEKLKGAERVISSSQAPFAAYQKAAKIDPITFDFDKQTGDFTIGNIRCESDVNTKLLALLRAMHELDFRNTIRSKDPSPLLNLGEYVRAITELGLKEAYQAANRAEKTQFRG